MNKSENDWITQVKERWQDFEEASKYTQAMLYRIVTR